eukprot:2619058-Amphidinium_carterae.2
MIWTLSSHGWLATTKQTAADKVRDCLRKLDRPQHGTSGTAPTVLYDGVENDEEAWAADWQQWPREQPAWSEWEGADQEWWPEEDDQFWAASRPEQHEADVEEEYTEEEAWSALNEVYAQNVTYPQVRQAMAQDRLRRGYFPSSSASTWSKGKGKQKGKPPWLGKMGSYPGKGSMTGKSKPTFGSGKAMGMGKQSRLQQIMARTKCNRCGQESVLLMT